MAPAIHACCGPIERTVVEKRAVDARTPTLSPERLVRQHFRHLKIELEGLEGNNSHTRSNEDEPQPNKTVARM